MDCVWITAVRTGAATALAAKYLARPDSTSVGILGCGVQGRSNLAALAAQFALTRVVAYDPLPGAAARFAEHAKATYGVAATATDDPRAAVSGCDLVVTAGDDRVRHCTIQPGWLDAGSFASLVDMDVAWDDRAMQEVDKYVTDDLGQYQSYVARGFHFQGTPPLYGLLGEIVAGKRPGRTSAAERTMTCNIGCAIGDMATASLVYARALAQGLGRRLPL
jgi:ornithine cyclodeaminase/alanine dehydrogenase-like protein (mu-crystallin family)